MPVSAEIFSVDTVQIEPASEAFRAGSLTMSASPADVSAVASEWADLPGNWIMIIICTVAAIIFLNRFMGLSRYIFGGFLRWKEIVSLENSVRLTRDRNTVAAISFLMVVLVVSRFEIYSPEYLLRIPPDFRTLGIFGAFIAIMLLRESMVTFLSAYTRNIEQYRISNRAIYNFIIFMSVILLVLVVIMLLFDINPLIIKTWSIITIALVYSVFLIRKTQIISKACGHVTAFLYLCILELLPAGILVASEFIL